MEAGIKLSTEITVDSTLSAASMRSGTLDVLATPAMIALIEKTAWQSVSPYLEQGQATVGTALNIKHIAPTPLGMKVRCDTVLTKIDGRKLTFKADVYDETGLIGCGMHERFIVNAGKFQAKANAKSAATDI